MDEENSLLYIRARYYSTKRGRFITKDPTTGKDGDSQSMNRYIYALNNPVRLIDISGLSAQDPGSSQNLLNSSDTLHNNMCMAPTPTGSQDDWQTFQGDFGVTYRTRLVKTYSQLTWLEKVQYWAHNILPVVDNVSGLVPGSLSVGKHEIKIGDAGNGAVSGGLDFISAFIPNDPLYEVDESSFFVPPIGYSDQNQQIY
jgi:RHS repeat-associated protein